MEADQVAQPNNNQEDYIPPDEELKELFLSESSVPYKRREIILHSELFKKEITRLEKIEHKNGKLPDKIIEEEKKPIEPIEVVSEEKKINGRPKIWTPEKIAQLRAEKKALTLQKQEQKKNDTLPTKMSLNHPLNKSEKALLSERVIKTRKELDEALVEKRNTYKNLEQIRGKESKCNHLDKFGYYSMEGHIISSCCICSRERIWEPVEWAINMMNIREKV